MRGARTDVPPFEINNSAKRIDGIRGNALEIIAQIEPGSTRACGLRVHVADDGSRGTEIRWDGTRLHVAGFDFPFELSENERVLKLHLFVDKGVVDLFVNDGRAAETRLVFPPAEDLGVEVFAEGGAARFKSLEAWTMNSIHPK